MVVNRWMMPRAAGAVIALLAMVSGFTIGVRAARAAEDAAATEAATSDAETTTPAAVEPAPEFVSAGGVDWYVDYYSAYRAAAAEKRFLLINVVPTTMSSAQQSAENFIAQSGRLQEQLKHVVRLRVSCDATISVEGQTRRLLSFGSFAELSGGSGFVLIDLCNTSESYYGGKYYHFRPDYLSTILSVPAGTLTQRTMIWAVRIHPERPQSTGGMHHPTLADGAMQQASYQANAGQQGHQNFETRFHSLSAAAGSGVSEVCAESWPGQNMIDSCIDCVDSWRHSSGHWQGVSRPHRAFGYDIRRGRNGIWYGTGIFAD
jgi:hypothetical protein